MPTFSLNNESRKLFFSSDKANVNLSKSHLFYYLSESIKANPGSHIFLTLLDAQIPISFHQQKSITLEGTVGSSNFSITIPDGTYSSSELVAIVNSLITSNTSVDLSISYDEATNGFIFTSSATPLVINASSHLLQFGLTNETHTGSSGVVRSNVAVDLMPIKNVYLKIQNLSVANSFNGVSSKIIAKIPIDLPRYSLINYKAHSNIATEVLDMKIDTLEFIIEDDEGNEIDFRAVPFSFSLGLVFQPKTNDTTSFNTVEEEEDYLKSKQIT
jgi:hypothetical protein